MKNTLKRSASSVGTPISSPTTSRGNMCANSVTNSTSPRSMKASMISFVISRTRGSSSATCRGVKKRLMSRLCRVWSGGSFERILSLNGCEARHSASSSSGGRWVRVGRIRHEDAGEDLRL